jgi:hypothetical protein
MEGSDWGGDDESDEEVEIKDIPSLMNVVRKARLDREKIEAVLWFAEEGGEEITYLAEKVGSQHTRARFEKQLLMVQV